MYFRRKGKKERGAGDKITSELEVSLDFSIVWSFEREARVGKETRAPENWREIAEKLQRNGGPWNERFTLGRRKEGMKLKSQPVTSSILSPGHFCI